MNAKKYFNHYSFFALSMLTIIAYFMAPTLLTFKNSLIGVSGEIKSVSVDYIPVKARRVSSIKAKLIITLVEDNRQFQTFKNIGGSRYHEKYETILSDLNRSQTATVWIRKSQNNKMNPEIFQVADEGNNILFTLKDAKETERTGLWINLLLITFFSILSVYHANKK